jgi:hypothetical protein
MPIDETKLTTLVEQKKAALESRLSVNTPKSPKAFTNVLAVTQAAAEKSLERYATERAKANLATTASLDDLKARGVEEGVPINPAIATQINVTMTATAAASLPIGTQWIADSTGAYFTTNATYTEAGGNIVAVLTAEDRGSDSNLDVAETLSIGAPVAGVGSVSTVTSTEVEGADEETITSYRRRVLAEIRNKGGGGNLADYREWSEEVSGVANAYPYSGKPITWGVTADDIFFSQVDSSINSMVTDFTDADVVGVLGVGCMITTTGSAANDGQYTVQSVLANKIVVAETIIDEGDGPDITLVNTSLPGDRTVFVESISDVDGIPTASLLESVRDSITTGTDGINRPPLGDIDSTLYVEPISRTGFDIEISGVSVIASLQAQATTKLTEAMAAYFALVEPYIDGLDFELDKNDTITDLSVSAAAQDVLQALGGYADSLTIAVSGDILPSYQVGQGEKAKVASLTINYV